MLIAAPNDTREPLTGDADRNGRVVSEQIGLAIAVPIACGLVVGLAAPAGDRTEPWGQLSLCFGWVAFFAWNICFYTQILLNFQRRSVAGVSQDYYILNIAGFGCYLAFTGMLFWDPKVQQEYREAHMGQSSAVRLSDVLYAGNALLSSMFVLLQFVIYDEYSPLDRADRVLRVVTYSTVALLVVTSLSIGVVIWHTSEAALTWLTYLQGLGQVKVIITALKYWFQARLNFKRKSTEGMSMGRNFLDFIGGLLTVGQLLIDGWIAQDWSAVMGNLPKLLLGNVAMFFDIVFFVQHFCVYSGTKRRTFPAHV